MANDKTIRQIADELGISKMLVYRTIQKERIKGHYENDRTLHYTETQEQAIKAALKGKIHDTDVTDIVTALNDRIKSQQHQIEELTKLLNQSQQLQLMAEHKLGLLEKPKNTSSGDSALEVERKYPSTEKHPETANMAAEQPSSFWARLFGKHNS